MGSNIQCFISSFQLGMKGMGTCLKENDYAQLQRFLILDVSSWLDAYMTPVRNQRFMVNELVYLIIIKFT